MAHEVADGVGRVGTDLLGECEIAERLESLRKIAIVTAERYVRHCNEEYPVTRRGDGVQSFEQLRSPFIENDLGSTDDPRTSVRESDC